MDFIILSLGTNVGERLANLSQARIFLQEKGIEIIKASSIYETEPYGMADQGTFLNQVLIVEAEAAPDELLEICLEVENMMGRVRNVPNGPRLIDVDILFYKDEMRDSGSLKLPHPGIPQRKFVLIPLVEIAPGQVHPVLKKTIRELLSECDDPLWVRLFGQ